MATSRQKKSFRILLNPNQLITTGVLFFLSLVVSFYMGLVTGKSLRVPQALERPAPEAAQADVPKVDPNALEVFQLSEPEDNRVDTIDLEKLKRLRANTEDMISQGKVKKAELSDSQSDIIVHEPEIEEQEATSQFIPVTVQTTQATTTSVPTTTQPPPVTATISEYYTLQLLSVQTSASAQAMVNRLQEDGVDSAHIETYNAPNNITWFRVRVGKMNKQDAEQMALRLRRLDYVDSVRMLKL